MMFKKSSFEDEIYQSMEKNLISHQVENIHGFSKIAKAVECLNAAVDIFEQAGMNNTAIEVTQVLQDLAKDIR